MNTHRALLRIPLLAMLLANPLAQAAAPGDQAPPALIPEPLKQQLRVGGRLVIPVGQSFQRLIRITRSETGFEEENVLPVRFVPMTGRAQRD